MTRGIRRDARSPCEAIDGARQGPERTCPSTARRQTRRRDGMAFEPANVDDRERALGDVAYRALAPRRLHERRDVGLDAGAPRELKRGVTCARAQTTGEDALALDTLLEPAAQLRDPGCSVTCASERDRHVVERVEAEARAQIFTDTTGIPGRQEVRAVEHDDLARDPRPPGAQVIRVRDVIAVLLRIDDPSHGIDAR